MQPPPHPVEARLALYSRLMTAAVAGIFLVGGGVAGLLAAGDNPAMLGKRIGMVEAGIALLAGFAVAFFWYLRKNYKLIHELEVDDV